jgi:flagellar assembly factor FliW
MIKTIDTRFGKIQIDDQNVFVFPMGLPGFAQRKEFVIIDKEEHYPFKWLQSVDDPELAFFLSNPLLFYPQYHVQISKAELSAIDAEKEECLELWVIMTISAQAKEITANLCAPLIFNLENRKAQQFVLSDRRYPVKYYIFGSPDGQNQTVVSQNIGTPSTDHRSLSLR